MKLFRFLILFCFAIPLAAHSYEVDDFLCSQKLSTVNPEDEKRLEQTLNEFTETKLKEAIEAINGKIQEEIESGRVNHTTCEDWGTNYNYLFKSIRKRLSASLVSELEVFVAEQESPAICHVKKKDSIYNGRSDRVFKVLSILESLRIKSALGDSLKICGVVTGSDKLGHFFGEGMDLLPYGRDSGGFTRFSRAYKHNKGFENGVLGKGSTGVFSFADMVASVEGGHFYSAIVHKQTDHQQRKAHIFCDQKTVTIKGKQRTIPAFVYNSKRPFDWCEYVNQGWNESVNCSDYTPKIQAVVDKNMAAKGFKCPLDPSQCVQAYEQTKLRFPRITDQLLHPSCLQAAKASGKTEKNSPTGTPGVD